MSDVTEQSATFKLYIPGQSELYMHGLFRLLGYAGASKDRIESIGDGAYLTIEAADRGRVLDIVRSNYGSDYVEDGADGGIAVSVDPVEKPAIAVPQHEERDFHLG
jgi:hypothetical protein